MIVISPAASRRSDPTLRIDLKIIIAHTNIRQMPTRKKASKARSAETGKRRERSERSLTLRKTGRGYPSQSLTEDIYNYYKAPVKATPRPLRAPLTPRVPPRVVRSSAPIAQAGFNQVGGGIVGDAYTYIGNNKGKVLAGAALAALLLVSKDYQRVGDDQAMINLLIRSQAYDRH